MTRLQIWIRLNVKWLFPLLGAIVMAVKPIYLSQRYGLPDVLAAASLVLAAFLTYWIPNVESGGLAGYGKALIVITLAGIGAAQQAIPGGISRADVWTIATALAAAAGTFLFGTTATKAVQSGGPGRLGDRSGPMPFASVAAALNTSGSSSGLARGGIIVNPPPFHFGGESGPETVERI